MVQWLFRRQRYGRIPDDPEFSRQLFENSVSQKALNHNQIKTIEHKELAKNVLRIARNDLGQASLGRWDHDLELFERVCKRLEPRPLLCRDVHCQPSAPRPSRVRD